MVRQRYPVVALDDVTVVGGIEMPLQLPRRRRPEQRLGITVR
jgi:hypothetical protein